MNSPVDLADLPSISHMNRPQKRTLILRDQLKFLDTKHLDTFLTGIGDPEPPNYKVVNGKLHPPFAEIVLKEGATQLDLGNVQFTKNEREWVSRVHLVIAQGKCEMSESDALPIKDDDLNSVSIHAFLVEQMIPLFMKKYEAIDTRKRSLNELRQVARGALSQQKIRISPGKSLEKLLPENDGDGRAAKGNDPRKRTAGDLVSRHVTNKRQRIGLDDIPDIAKSVIFNNIPEAVKIDLFNNVVKTALPNFDDLMTAAWNVIYIHKSVGSEDRELYKSIGILEKVLVEFASFHRKSQGKPESQEKMTREQPLPPKRIAYSSTEEMLSGKKQMQDKLLEDRAQGRVDRRNDESAEEGEIRDDAHNRRDEPRNGRYAADYHAQNESATSQRKHGESEEERASLKLKRLKELKERLEYQKSNRSNIGAMPHHEEDSPSRIVSEEGSGYYDNRSFNTQREQPNLSRDPRKNAQEQHHSSTSQDPSRPTSNFTCEGPLRQLYNDGLDGSFEDTVQEAKYGGGEKPRPATTHAVFLGKSKLGAPKMPLNAMGFAPVAPMMHIRKEGADERRTRPMQ